MSSSPPEGHRTFTITPSDQSGTIVVTSTLLMTWSLLCFMLRVYNRLALASNLGLDDFASGLSTVFGVVQTIVACAGVAHGLGQAAMLLEESQILQISTYEYAVEIVCLAAIGASKIAMVFFFLRITPQRTQRIVCYALAGVCACWAIAAIVTAAIRCDNSGTPAIFNRTCDDYSARWTGIAITDCLLEAAIFGIPIWILYDLRTPLSYKIAILLSFASRLFVVVASALHASTATHWAETGFRPIEVVTPFIWLQVETHYAIMSATFPTLGTILKSLNTRWGALDGPDVAQYAMESLSASNGGTKKGQTNGSKHDTAHEQSRFRPEPNGYTFRVRSPPAVVHTGPIRKNSDDSEQMMIRKTISTSVEHELSTTQ